MDHIAFKAWRHRLGLSIHGAAQALGVSVSQVCRYQAGRSPISETISKLCRLLESQESLRALNAELLAALILVAECDALYPERVLAAIAKARAERTHSGIASSGTKANSP